MNKKHVPKEKSPFSSKTSHSRSSDQVSSSVGPELEVDHIIPWFAWLAYNMRPGDYHFVKLTLQPFGLGAGSLREVKTITNKFKDIALDQGFSNIH